MVVRVTGNNLAEPSSIIDLDENVQSLTTIYL
jgi:hypothetical protein